MMYLYQFLSEAFTLLKLVTMDIVTELIHYTPYIVMIGVAIATALFVMLKIRWKSNFNTNFRIFYPKYILIILMCLYAILIILITLLSREPGSRSRLDLIPFSTFSADLSSNCFPIENILLFIPFGILLPMLWSKFRRVFISTGAGFLISLLIEITQHLTKRGFLQTDDVITNTLGALLGYGLFILMGKLKKKATDVKLSE